MIAVEKYEGVSKSFGTQSITK